jgi:3-hydroxyacyl-CoA dehydrogenase
MQSKIGVLGSGVVAQTLAAGFNKHGHPVMIGTRDKQKLQEWSTQTRAFLWVASAKRRRLEKSLSSR